MNSAIRMPSRIASMGVIPAPSSPANLVTVSAAAIAERFAVPTIERSMPPVSMVIMMANARIPNSGICTAIDCMLRMVKNLPGSKMLKATKITIAMINRRSV